jgi:transcriptional regulator with XRE-family HTH domain
VLKMLEDLGPNVRRARRDRDLTQAQLARVVGIRQQALSEIERGLRSPHALVDRLARLLGVPSQALRQRPE